MNENRIKDYLVQDIEGFYYNNNRDEYLLKGVSCPDDRTRNNMAFKQAAPEPKPLSEVYAIINEFIELIRQDNGYTSKKRIVDSVTLDGANHLIVYNGIIIRNCSNGVPIIDYFSHMSYKYDMSCIK